MRKRIVPGFGLTLGFTLAYISILIFLPLGALVFSAAGVGFREIVQIAVSPRVLAAFQLSFVASFIAAGVNLVFGSIVAWVLVRYSFPGKRVLDGLIDLPFALPTSVAGIALTSIYASNGCLGSLLAAIGIKVAFTPVGVLIALIFVGLPFVVRSMQPVLEDLDAEIEEAAATMGANRLQVFISLIIPAIWPSALAGFSLAFARALGEYGSVVFISGNMPFRTEIVPLLIMTKLEQFDYKGAAVIGALMLFASLILLMCINAIQGLVESRFSSNTNIRRRG